MSLTVTGKLQIGDMLLTKDELQVGNVNIKANELSINKHKIQVTSDSNITTSYNNEVLMNLSSDNESVQPLAITLDNLGMGASPPSGAKTLFDGTALSVLKEMELVQVKRGSTYTIDDNGAHKYHMALLDPTSTSPWLVDETEGVLYANTKANGENLSLASRAKYCNQQMHYEFKCAQVPDADQKFATRGLYKFAPDQSDSNSGVYFAGNYECQVLGRVSPYGTQGAGSVYYWEPLLGGAKHLNGTVLPDRSIDISEQWNSVDIIFKAGVYDKDLNELSTPKVMILINGKCAQYTSITSDYYFNSQEDGKDNDNSLIRN